MEIPYPDIKRYTIPCAMIWCDCKMLTWFSRRAEDAATRDPEPKNRGSFLIFASVLRPRGLALLQETTAYYVVASRCTRNENCLDLFKDDLIAIQVQTGFEKDAVNTRGVVDRLDLRMI